MKKYIAITILMTILAGMHTGCNEDNNGSSTTMHTSQFEDAQGSCTNGGIKFEILVDGVVDNTQTQYVCNGTQGQAGQNGTNITMRTTPFEGVQGSCTNGGIKFEILVDGVADNAQTQYVCNGTQGQAGQNGTNTTMRTTPFEGVQGSCTNGGVKFEVLVNGSVDANQTQYICNGQKGDQGEQGEAGCSNGEKSCGNTCVDVSTSIENCGTCGHDCNAEKTENVKTMNCLDSACYAVDCMTNYHIETEDDKRVCKEDTVNACGIEATNCTAYAWWDGGSCENGKCIPTACNGDYHLMQDELGVNWCEPDSNANCGSHGHECAEGLICAGGRCLGNLICDGVLRNTLNDLDHCGECNHRCEDGLICDLGQCKLGYGQAYCSDTKVTVGTIDRCSGCSDRCADGLICQNNACVAGIGETYCSGKTFNTAKDLDHCGRCDHKCDDGLICNEGSCQTGNGIMYCNDVIINSIYDSAHCSGCGNLCPVGYQCDDSSGTPRCVEGIFDITYCNGAFDISLSNDSANCGQCGKLCDVGESCSSGVCISGSGPTYCDGVSLNTLNDSSNCGQCGKLCGVGESCSSGVCTSGSGQTYCDGKSRNLLSDAANCGQCGIVCSDGEGCARGICIPGLGDIITFGHYEQDNDPSNGKEPIEWRILDRNDEGQYLVISEKVLDKKSYNTSDALITWETSTIRSWLNGYTASYNTDAIDFTSDNFIDSAFSAEEKAKIIASNVPAHANPEYSTPPGNATTDKVFLLSIVEAQNYFTDEASRLADSTRYAVKQGLFVRGSESWRHTLNGTCTEVYCYAYWWLRSPGCDTAYAAGINTEGSVYPDGYYVFRDHYGVRPALWVEL